MNRTVTLSAVITLRLMLVVATTAAWSLCLARTAVAAGLA
jgi:hypothetical protein